jgi:hypothetical protein
MPTTSTLPALDGLAQWLREEAPRKYPSMPTRLLRWADAVESLEAALAVPAQQGLSDTQRLHIHQAIEMLGDYEAEAREGGNDSVADGASATRYVLESLFRSFPALPAAPGTAAPALEGRELPPDLRLMLQLSERFGVCVGKGVGGSAYVGYPGVNNEVILHYEEGNGPAAATAELVAVIRAIAKITSLETKK